MKSPTPQESKHEHIWKYTGPYERVCEAPFPFIDSCGKEEIYHTDQCCGEGWGS